MLARGSWRRIRGTLLRLAGDISYINNSQLRFVRASAFAEWSPGETVYNIEVADDHSYVANGFVVHNCDLYAKANLYGLGAGVYPGGEHPYPAHPNTISFITPVFKDEISDADRAGKQTPFEWIAQQSANEQDMVLGGRQKGAAFRAGLLNDGDLRMPWWKIAERLGINDPERP